MRLPTILLVCSLVLPACHGERPRECQILRQCCAAAGASGGEVETVRVQCTRKDDHDPVLCRRRFEEVIAALPQLADHDDCKMPPRATTP